MDIKYNKNSMLDNLNVKKNVSLNLEFSFSLVLFFLADDAISWNSIGSKISWFLLIGLVVLLHSIAFSRDLITSCVSLLFIFIISGILLCVYDLIYIGVLYLLVYAGGLSILFIFIIFLFDLEKDYTSSVNIYGLLTLFIGCILFSGLYAEFCKIAVLDNPQTAFDSNSWINYYRFYTYSWKKYGIGVVELALSLYLNNLHLIVLVGFILALCTVGPILIVSGPFIAKPVYTTTLLNVSFESHAFWTYLRFITSLVLIYSFFSKIALPMLIPLTASHMYPFFQLLPIFIVVIILYFILLYLSVFFGSLKFVSVVSKEQATPYECGFAPYESSRTRFEVHFFLVAILFLIFDIEVTYIYPYVLVQDLLPVDSSFVLLFFLLILGFGLLYEWYSGVLFWSEEHSDEFRVQIKK